MESIHSERTYKSYYRSSLEMTAAFNTLTISKGGLEKREKEKWEQGLWSKETVILSYLTNFLSRIE